MSQLGSVGGTGLTLGAEDDRRRSSAARPCFPQTPDTAQLDLLSGPHLRDEGTNRVLANEAAEWRTRAEAAVAELARLCAAGVRETFSCEDVRSVVGDPPHHANSMGAVILRAKRRGLIRLVDYSTATRREAHATRLALYTAGDEA